MGVLACGRRDCQNILCERWSDTFRVHLCEYCFDELATVYPKVSVTDFLLSSVHDQPAVKATRILLDNIFPRRPSTSED